MVGWLTVRIIEIYFYNWTFSAFLKLDDISYEILSSDVVLFASVKHGGQVLVVHLIFLDLIFGLVGQAEV